MSKYGTIPKSSSAPAATAPSSPFLPVHHVQDRGASRLSTHRPWRELVDPRTLSVPPVDLGDIFRRVGSNLHYFAANYAALSLLAAFLPLIWRPPAAQLAFLACVVAWLLLFFLRDGPLVLCGGCVVVPEGVVLAALSAITLVVLLLTNPAVNVLKSLAVGVVLVLLHAALHRDAARWYTIMAPSSPTY